MRWKQKKRWNEVEGAAMTGEANGAGANVDEPYDGLQRGPQRGQASNATTAGASEANVPARHMTEAQRRARNGKLPMTPIHQLREKLRNLDGRGEGARARTETMASLRATASPSVDIGAAEQGTTPWKL